MKAPAVLLGFLLLAASVLAGDAPRKIAFERGDQSIWVANLDGTGAKQIAGGKGKGALAVDPDISPDGTKVAFTVDQSANSGVVRHIGVVNLASVDLAVGQLTVLKDVPSNNVFGPVWSPDGSKILFYIMMDGNWNIGLVSADGTGFRVLKKAEGSKSFFSACWTPDGQSIYCQDLENLYHLGLDGAVIKQWPIQKLFPGGDMDSGMRFDVSPDGKTLLVELNSGEEHGRKDWDGPAPSTWALDLTTEKAKKLTPLFWWDACWLSNDEFLCISQGVKEKEPSIYRVSLDGKTHKLLIKNARTPSISKAPTPVATDSPAK